ncbi:MAG: DnaJ domain-containing protein [Mastigocoleus sp. MO_167.B18]|nr:DnaJ domain-containing protein [Mastigocoleus sp. MO_167.B18]
MSFRIERGLFKYDLTDYHAVLGVPLDAEPKEIRKRYLKIARCLHPDRCACSSAADQQLASDLLSKLVNPAYEKLSAERSRAEYTAVLTQMGKRLIQESASIQLDTDGAKQLASAPNINHLYKNAIANMATSQYDSLEEVLEKIAQISELNVVYLMRNGGKKFAPPPPPPTSPQVTGNTTSSPPKSSPSPNSAPTPSPESSITSQYIRRAQDLINKNQLALARVELQDALKLEPNNSCCHSLLGVVYLKQNQIKMAKVHFDRTLQLDPKDEQALAGKRKIEQILGKKPGDAKSGAKLNTGTKQPNKSGGNGLFGGLFGGKKK